MNKDLAYNERKEWAKMLYTREDKTIKDITLTVGIEEADVRLWVVEGAWDGIKRSLMISKETQLAHLYNILEKLNSKSADEVTIKDVDHILKYTTIIKNLEVAPSRATVLEVSDLFIHWLRRKDIELTRTLIVHFDAFIKELYV